MEIPFPVWYLGKASRGFSIDRRYGFTGADKLKKFSLARGFDHFHDFFDPLGFALF